MFFFPTPIFQVTDSSDFLLAEQLLATRTEKYNQCGLQYCAWEIPSALQYKCISELNFTSIVMSDMGSLFQKKSQTLYPN